MADDPSVRVVVGVDTHKDFHVAHAKDHLGRSLGEFRVKSDAEGYRQLLDWARGLGVVDAFGIEGPGSYGAGLARHLSAAGEVVLEVGRPNRQHRARYGKSDPADAAAAAEAVLADNGLGAPKSANGPVEMMRILHLTRASAIRAKRAAVTTMHDLLVTGPDEIRERLRGLSAWKLVRACAVMTPARVPSTPAEAAQAALVALAQRCLALEAEAKALEAQIAALVRATCPGLLELVGVGPEIAAMMLITIGDNARRVSSEAALAKLCGVSPIDASSGRQIRHRLNRGGNRQANRALHTLIVVRLRMHPPTQAYMTRRLAEGKTKAEIIRCLKRYVIRELFTVVQATCTGPAHQIAA
jgi:transposase